MNDAASIDPAALAILRSTPALLRMLLADLPRDVLHRPNPEGWSIKDIVAHLHDELIKVMALPTTIEKLASIGMDNSTSATPAAFTQWIKQQNDRWPPLFKAAAIQPE